MLPTAITIVIMHHDGIYLSALRRWLVFFVCDHLPFLLLYSGQSSQVLTATAFLRPTFYDFRTRRE